MNEAYYPTVEDLVDNMFENDTRNICEFCKQDLDTSDRNRCTGECDYFPLEEDSPLPVNFNDD